MQRWTTIYFLSACLFPCFAGSGVFAEQPSRFTEHPLRTVSADPSQRVATARQVAADPGLIRLEAIHFDPLVAGTPDLTARVPEAPSLRSATPGQPRHYLVQFSAPITKTQHRVVRSLGGEVLGAVPGRTLLVRLADGVAEDSLHAAPGARYVGRFQPGYKISSAVVRAVDNFANAGTVLTIDVSLFSDEDVDTLVSAVRTRFPEVGLGYVKRTPPQRLTLQVSGSDLGPLIGALVRDPAVQFVDRRHPLELHNDNSVWTVQSYDRVNGPTEAQAPAPAGYPASAGIWNRGLNGGGQIIAIADTGLEYDTCFFADTSVATIPQTVVPPGRLTLQDGHRKILALNAPFASALNTDGSFRHGTHVAASAAGDDMAHLASPVSAGHDPGDGIAPGAKIIFQDISGNVNSACSTWIVVSSTQELLEQEYDAGARISTNSWGSSAGTGGHGDLQYHGASYDSSTHGVDQSTWDQEDFLVFFSAGNGGGNGLGGNAVCKNCVTVGATENWDPTFLDALGILDPENMTAFSSRGPTSDGRTKPDLVAPGYFVYSDRFETPYYSNSAGPECTAVGADACFPSFGGCYVTETSDSCPVGPLLGTSMATPIAAGVGALARQYFVEGFYPSGQANAADAESPTAAALKAVLINGSRNMTGHLYERRGTAVDFGLLADAPSSIQGWGRLALDDALYFDGESRRLIVVDVPHAAGLTTGALHETRFSVTDTAQPLKITLVWSDPPGPIFVGGSLINDLDLELIAPDGTVYRGNQWTADLPNVSGEMESLANPGGTDAINNVEGALLQTPQSGSYLARVRGTAIPGGGGILTQGFGLVVTGGVVEGIATPVPDGSSGTPMLADRTDGSGSSIDVSWDVTSCTSTDYHILHGPLSGVNVLQLDGAVCDLGRSGSYSWAGVPPGDRWFLVVGDDDGEIEGPWGEQSGGAQRNGASVSGECGLLTRENAATCP